MLHWCVVLCVLSIFPELSTTQSVSLGKFLYNGHGLQGEVIVLNDRQYRIKGFSYDGKGPAVWHTGMRRGTVGVYSEDAYAFRNENNDCNRLAKRYSGKDVVITLPRNMSISRDLQSIAVYCHRFCHNFGHVKVPRHLNVRQAPNNLGSGGLCRPNYPPCSRDRTKDNGVCETKSGNLDTCPLQGQSSSPNRNRLSPRTSSTRGGSTTPVRVGRFISHANGVTGEVIILNDRQFRIRGFRYTGARGSSTHFMLMEKGTAGVFSVKSSAVPDERGKCSGLRAYKGEDIVVTVPNDISISRDVAAIAVYDHENCVNFGHLALPRSLVVGGVPRRGVPSRSVCLPYFRPCSRRDTTNPGVCKSRSGRETTC